MIWYKFVKPIFETKYQKKIQKINLIKWGYFITGVPKIP